MLLDSGEWLAVLRIALGLWWLESFRHKDKAAWIQRGAGIGWAKSVAEKHRWSFVRSTFAATAGKAPKAFTFIVLGAELALGLGLTIGLLTPIALACSALLALVYFVLMIHDWAEQGQCSMMIAISVALLGSQAWGAWSADAALGWFGMGDGGWFGYAPNTGGVFDGTTNASWTPAIILTVIALVWGLSGIRKGYKPKPAPEA